MANFHYLATDSQNKQLKGALEAKDLLEAKTKLRQLGFYIIWIRKESNLNLQFSFGRVRNSDLAVFSHQFSVMISSGIPLIRALRALAEETSNAKLRFIIEKVRLDVENGTSLSNAFSKYPEAFSEFFVNLVKSGEAGGILASVLSRLAKHFEKEEDLRRKVTSSLAYPAIVGIFTILVVVFLLIFVVPVFRSVYKSLKVSLPGPTVALVALSDFFVKYWWLILLFMGLAFYFLRKLRQNAVFGLKLDSLKLRLPLFGQLNRKVAVSRFVRTLSTMIGSGLTLNPSLTIVKDIVGNRVIAHAIEGIQEGINKGIYLSDALKAQAFFPPIAVQMISVGEESGNLNTMLDKCADFLDEDIDTLIKSLVVKLEPTLTFILAVIVGFIALAIYLPVFDLIRQIQR